MPIRPRARPAVSGLPSPGIATGVASWAILAWMPVGAQPPAVHMESPRPFEVELFGVQGLRSDARLPSDTSVARQAIDSLTTGALPVSGRTEVVWPIGVRTELRGLAAPFLMAGAGPLVQDIVQRGAVADTAASYRADSYRLTWRYAWIDSPQLSVKLGMTANVRDLRAASGSTGAPADRTGSQVLPLLHASVESPFGGRLLLAADVDALAGPQGRAVDAGVRLRYALDRDWSASVSYRILDGNADGAALFNAVRFQYLGVGVRRAF